MHAYRDMYAQVFNGGKNVVLIGISADSPEDLASWAADDDFPFLMATDADWSVAASYGIPLRENGFLGARSVVVIDPDGTQDPPAAVDFHRARRTGRGRRYGVRPGIYLAGPDPFPAGWVQGVDGAIA